MVYPVRHEFDDGEQGGDGGGCHGRKAGLVAENVPNELRGQPRIGDQPEQGDDKAGCSEGSLWAQDRFKRPSDQDVWQVHQTGPGRGIGFGHGKKWPVRIMPIAVLQQVRDLQTPGDVVNIMDRAAIQGVSTQHHKGHEQENKSGPCRAQPRIHDLAAPFHAALSPSTRQAI